MSEPRASYAPHAILTSLIAIWGLSFVIAKVAMQSVTPVALVGLRFTLAAVCLLPFVRLTRADDLRRTFVPGLIAGTVLGAGYFLQMSGIHETTASTGGFLAGLIVLLVALGGFLFFGARLGPQSLFGLALGLGGMVLVCLPAGDAGAGAQQDTLRGILLQIGSSTAFAAHILLLSHYGRGLPIAPFTLWQLVVVSTAGLIGIALQGGLTAHGEPAALSLEPLLAIAYLGVLATAMGIFLQAKVQHRIPPTPLALLFALQPLFAAGFGWLLQGDRLGAMQWAGGALIVTGVVVTSLAKSQRAAAPSPAAS